MRRTDSLPFLSCEKRSCLWWCSRPPRMRYAICLWTAVVEMAAITDVVWLFPSLFSMPFLWGPLLKSSKAMFNLIAAWIRCSRCHRPVGAHNANVMLSQCEVSLLISCPRKLPNEFSQIFRFSKFGLFYQFQSLQTHSFYSSRQMLFKRTRFIQADSC